MDRRWMALVLLLTLLSGCGKKPPYGSRSVRELEGMLEDPHPEVQAQGALGLGLHGSEARSAVPALVRTLKSPDTLVRQQAALALGKISGGDADAATVTALMDALGDPQWSVRRQAALALGEIGAPAHVAAEALRRCLRDPNNVVRKAAHEALAKIVPPKAAKARPQ
jgi:HEAT repeat protein